MSLRSRKIAIALVFLVAALSFLFWKNHSDSASVALTGPAEVTPATEFPKVQFFKDARAPASFHEKRHNPNLLYKLKSNATKLEKEELQKALGRFNFKNKKKTAKNKVDLAVPAMPADIDPTQLEKVIEQIANSGAVDYVESDRHVDMAYTPNDPQINVQWHLNAANVFSAWDHTMGQNTVIVANCDTGVDATHPELRGNLILPGYNSMDGSNDSSPIHPHGTMTAGTTAAIAENGLGIAGVSPKVKILPIRVSNAQDGVSSFSALADCIVYAADHGAKVVNVSFDGSNSYTIDTAAQYLRAKGGLLVMAAGNSGADLSGFTDFTSFIIVGATDQNNQSPSWSNFGTPVDIVAPGVEIFTTAPGGSYVYVSGTSLATPIVSGAAALIYSLKNTFTPEEVENFLFSTANRLGTGANDNTFGNGVINVGEAVAKAKAAISPGTCNYPNWVQNQQYAAGSIVKYTDGKYYRAKNANPGHNPTISTYYWEQFVCSGGSNPTPTPSPTPLACNYPNWIQNQQYAAGSIVKYSDGKFYRAKNANPGYNPTISTFYWESFICSGGGNPTPTPTPTPTPVACNYPNWIQNQQYAAGSIVRYSDGKFYQAKYANPGYNPTISTFFWQPFACP